MPSCFSLTRNGDRDTSHLHDVDRAICQNRDIPYDPERWAHNWYNFIGLGLAIGHSFSTLAQIAKDHDDWVSVGIIAYLADNYTANNWREWR